MTLLIVAFSVLLVLANLVEYVARTYWKRHIPTYYPIIGILVGMIIIIGIEKLIQ